MPNLRLIVADTGAELTVAPRRLVVAGYTGRDLAAVRAHIDELAAIGVPPPAAVPTCYDLDPALLTTESLVAVPGDNTSGEAEPVLIRRHGRWYLGVGSDHTDRDLERADIATAKAVCPKPVGDRVVTLAADLPTAQWDGYRMTASVDGTDYQDGTLAALRTPSDLLSRVADPVGDVDGDLVVFAGTLPLLTGTFLPGTRWRLSLTAGDTTLTCCYDTERRNH